jgi:hypothetical protein
VIAGITGTLTLQPVVLLSIIGAMSKFEQHLSIIVYAGGGFDHGVGHSLLLLYDAKAPRGQKSKEFNDLGHDPSNAFISLF